MSEFAKEISNITVEEELKRSYLDYAMSVIIGRAIPDGRDGLKPVHRRILFAMYQLKNDWNKPYKKSARIVGDVIGKYHPHGDTAVYDAMVRMAQTFSMRHVLIQGQGNFGSIDGDAAAAMRYTEVRLSRFAHSLLEDLDKDTVDFLPNYDETEFAPAGLPTRIPNLLVNGSSGIAVGMATNVPPHNLNEVIDACTKLLEYPETTIDELIKIIPGPDFPTAAIISGQAGVNKAYKQGRGKIYMRSRVEIESAKQSDKCAIVVTELPYQVNKARLLEKIGELVRDKKINGISNLRDESDKDGMRIVIEVRRGENPDILLNHLFSQTQMQCVFGINMVVLSKGKPVLMNLKQLLSDFLSHRREVVTRRSLYELKKARQRAHILEGLGIALANIDEMIRLIKHSKDPGEAKQQLMKRKWPLGLVAQLLSEDTTLCQLEDLEESYGVIENDQYKLSTAQAQAILDLKLHRLTGLEKEKIIQEYRSLLDTIRSLLNILNDPDVLSAKIKEELVAVKEAFGTPRLTEILKDHTDLSDEDLIAQERVVVTVSGKGYVKLQALNTYQTQRRGGKGKVAAKIKEEDFVKYLLVANTHDTLLYFSNFGRVYWLKVYRLPFASRTASGKPLVNFLSLAEGENISAILPLCEYLQDRYLFMATEKGYVKKVSISQFSRPRSNGVIAIDLQEGDRLIGVEVALGDSDVMLLSNVGKAIRFNESMVRSMGRTARGVRGIRLKQGERVISLIIIDKDQVSGKALLMATEKGYGKRTFLKAFRCIKRGGQGVIAIQVNARNGELVTAQQVSQKNEVLLISDGGVLVRIPIEQISVLGRNTKGVRLINLNDGEKLIGFQSVKPTPVEKEEDS